MKQYLDLLNDIMTTGTKKEDRTGTGTISVFGRQLRFDISDNRIPLLTTKKIFTKAVVCELLWFLKGETNIKYLLDNNVHIWDEWATEELDLGPVYGKLWRQWGNYNSSLLEESENSRNLGIDQIANLISSIKNNPNSRRHIVTAWDPWVLPFDGMSPQENVRNGRQALAACHCLVQFNCEEISYAKRLEIFNAYHVKYPNHPINLTDEDLDNFGVPKYYLSSQLYQRSADMFLGVPFNIASYAILTHIIAKLTNTIPKEFVHTFGDLHVYLNHLEQVHEQLNRTPYPSSARLVIHKEGRDWDPSELEYGDLQIVGYTNTHPPIKAPVAV